MILAKHLEQGKLYSVGIFANSCIFFVKSKNALDFVRRYHKL